MKARELPNMVRVLSKETLPDGVSVLIVPCDGYEGLKRLSQVIEYEGRFYSRTGWNSDRNIAYYRNDAPLATMR